MVNPELTPEYEAQRRQSAARGCVALLIAPFAILSYVIALLWLARVLGGLLIAP